MRSPWGAAGRRECRAERPARVERRVGGAADASSQAGPLAAILLGAILTPAVPGLAASVRDVRIGLHPGFTRLVVETDRPCESRLVRGESEVRLHVVAAAEPALLPAPGVRLEAVRTEPTPAGGTDLRVRLKRPAVLRTMSLEGPPRIVLDFSDGTGGPRRSQPASPEVEPLGGPILAGATVRGAPDPLDPTGSGQSAADRTDVPTPAGGAEEADAGARRHRASRAAAAEGSRLEAPAEEAKRRKLTEREDEERPDDQLSVLVFGRPLTIGGEYEIRTLAAFDRRLGSRDDDLTQLRQTFELELFYAASETFSLFAKLKHEYRRDLYVEGGDRDSHGNLKRGQSWVHAADLWGSGVSLQVGRQEFRDKREWWWDDNLDSVRIGYEREGLELQLAVAEGVARESTDEDFIDPEDDDVLRVLGQLSWRYARRHRLELFALHQHDHSPTQGPGEILEAEREDEEDADLTWAGMRASGRWKLGSAGRLYYWGDLGFVWGEETVHDFDDLDGGRSFVDEVEQRDVRGWALDAGLTWATRWPGRPSFTMGYAFGSGDPSPGEGGSRAFRQTGLHDNSGRFRGVNRFRYYGELLDPELSNLHVGTLALGLPLFASSSVELLVHHYHQVHPAPFLRDAALRVRPEGRTGAIGQEVDVVVGLREWRHVRAELVGSAFRAGSAFGELRGQWSFGVQGKVEFIF